MKKYINKIKSVFIKNKTEKQKVLILCSIFIFSFLFLAAVFLSAAFYNKEKAQQVLNLKSKIEKNGIDFVIKNKELNIEKIINIKSQDIEKEIKMFLEKENLLPKNADLKYTNNKFEIQSGKLGIAFTLDDLQSQIYSRENLKIKNDKVLVYIKNEIAKPKIDELSATDFLPQAEYLKIKLYPINLGYVVASNTKKYFILNVQDILEILSLKESEKVEEKKYLGVSETKLNEKIKVMSEEVFKEKRNNVFEISTSSPKKVLKMEESQTGVRIDGQKLLLEIEGYVKDILKRSERERVESKNIIVENIYEAPEIKENSYGIKEVLGTGYSSFVGSDSARSHNIRMGLSKIDSTLIAPGEVFSLVSALAPFNKESGYIDGNVIRGIKITPEIGGGMCQLGTTLFRAAMHSGLKITERKNHSIWVSYYNDPKNGNPGTDATIYDPSPDFKFKNNTEKYIMIKVRERGGGILNIDFWGTSDGRIGSYTPPEVLSHSTTSKATTTYIFTKKLKAGETKCNGPFKGASTVFTYTVKMAGEEDRSHNFFSYYKPQEQVCQIGE